MGEKSALTKQSAKLFAAKSFEEAKKIRAKKIASILPVISKTAPAEVISAFVEGLLLSSYEFDEYKTGDKEDRFFLDEAVVAANVEKRTATLAIERGKIFAEATNFARDLINRPADDANPKAIAKLVEEMSRELQLSCEILSTKEMKFENMNCILSVARGSSQPPQFIILKHYPRGAKKHLVLVGKGITFDSGGLAIKSPLRMHEMKGDMAGAAAVIAAMRAISLIKCRAKITAIIPLCENMVDGEAIKPGDVVTARNGKTIEVINPDCEGRLILADALSYAADLKPSAIVDIATLTGGAAYCCGELYSLIMGNDPKLVEKIKSAAKLAGENVWELPIVDEYKKGYTSSIADLNNTGKSKAQTILGAIFLREFIKDIDWVHIDIAAASWADEKRALEQKGGTGVITRTLIELAIGMK